MKTSMLQRLPGTFASHTFPDISYFPTG